MIKIKKQILYGIIIGFSLIASCLTFNNAKNIDSYNYNEQIRVSNVNFWGPVTLYEKSDGTEKKKTLLVLLKDNIIQYVVSGDYSHYKRYKYFALNDTAHLLVKEPNKPILFSRVNERDSKDSILFFPNLCIRKIEGYRYVYNERNDAKYIIYSINQQNISEYTFEYKSKDSLLVTKPSLISFANRFRTTLSENKTIKFIRSSQIDQSTKEIFFRTKIM